MNAFTVKVYKAVLSIPVGQVRSYKWVARKAGSPDACRAVGRILKRNPYPLIIPCHRVVNSDKLENYGLASGSQSHKQAGGYVFGAKQKRFLLTLEKELAECMLSKE